MLTPSWNCSSASVAECTTLLCVVDAGNQEVKEVEVMFQFSILSSDTMCLFLRPLVWQNCLIQSNYYEVFIYICITRLYVPLFSCMIRTNILVF